MRSYGKITPGFWIGDTGRLLRGDQTAQLIALYLLTSPHANMIGLYYCPVAYIASDTGIPLEGASKGLRRLSEAGFCTLERGCDWIWVNEMARYQVGYQLNPRDKNVNGIKSELEKIPNIGIKRDFIEKYKEAFHLEDIVPPSPLEGASKPHRSIEIEIEIEKEKETLLTQCVEIEISTPVEPLEPSSSQPGSEVSVPAEPAKVVQIDPTPYQAITDAYHEILPGLRRVRKLTPARKTAIRSAWRDKTGIGPDLDRWRDYFSYVDRRCPFLMGRRPDRDGRAFEADLEWLVKPGNLAKVIEGKYEEIERHG